MKQLLQNMRNGKIEIKDIPVTQPSKGFVLVQTAYSLVSAGTERTMADFAGKSLVEKAASRPDLVKMVVEKARREGIVSTFESAMNRLDLPMYPGYSSAGRVAAVGADVSGFQVGDRVACGGGNYAVHAEYATVPKKLLVKLPDNVSYEEAAFATLGAVGMHGFRLASPQLNETVLVIGLGLLGLMTIQIAKAAGCKVMGIDISNDRVELARQLGCQACPRDEIESAVMAFTRGRGFDHILICAGSKDNDTIELAAELCRDRGTVIAIGAVGLEIPRKPFYNKEISFRVSRSYGPGRYDPEYEEKGQDYPIGFVRWTEGRNMEGFIDLLSANLIQVAPLITHRIPIEQGERAYDLIKGKIDEPCLGVLLEYPLPEAGSAPQQTPVQLKKSAPPAAVNLGVIGAGNYANATFLPILKSNTEGSLRLISIVSKNGASAREAADKFGFEKVDVSAEALLSDPEINAVTILNRHNLHSPMTVTALQNQKHVYCEKPLALDVDSLRNVIQAQRENPDPILMVGYNRRFSPLAQKLKDFLSECGEPLAMHYTVNAGYIPPAHWVQDSEIGGGRIIGECCHMIDFLIFLTGALPDQVSAVALPNNGIYRDDNVSLQLKFQDGSIGTINYLANGDKAYPKERIEVFSSGNIAVLNDFRSLETWKHGSRSQTKSSMRTDKGHSASWQAFVQSILNGGAAPIPADQLFAVSLTSLAALESLRSNDLVKIPQWDEI